jgi:haloalkane dehalogenase
MQNTNELPKNTCQVDGKVMAYVELGEGSPTVFLHGNPASSYIWRNIMPMVAPYGRCIAPDLIGMGDSEKLEGDDPMRYGSLQHRHFVEGLLEKLGVTEDVVLVGHDWGGALAMDWARRHAEAVRGIVYFETIVRSRSWDEMDPSARELFERLRSPEGETLVLRDNLFVEKSFSNRILRRLSDVCAWRTNLLRTRLLFCYFNNSEAWLFFIFECSIRCLRKSNFGELFRCETI